MSFLSNLASTILTGVNHFDRDEYGHVNRDYTPPEVTHVTRDECDRPVIHVKADNYIDAAKYTEGTTYPGDVYRQVVHKSGRDWDIRVKDFDTELEE